MIRRRLPHFALAALAAALASGCGHTGRPPATEPEAGRPGWQDAARFLGDWRETLPAADSPGRELLLRLTWDGGATLGADYLNGRAPILQVGTWSPQGADRIQVTLSRQDGRPKAESFTFGLADDVLTAVDYDRAAWGAAGLQLRREDVPPSDRLVLSFETLDQGDFGARLAQAADAGERWTRDPIAIVQRLCEMLFGGLDAATVQITRRDSGVENADRSTVIVTCDGYADDSIAGDWTRVRLWRESDGSWRVQAIERARRCARGDRLGVYIAEPCP